MPATQVWNLNEADGYYVRTGIRDPVIIVELGFNAKRGPIVPVGRFRLNLHLLSLEGITTRRGKVYDAKIFLEDDGSFMVGVRLTNRVPLEQFRC